tara:strand:- start:93 stop:554 length:462 start_codon:yes stop_codon:yes gene_type:complete
MWLGVFTMVQMTMKDIEVFLSEPRTATFATVSPNQIPQLTTVWFLYDQKIFYFGIERSSVKYKNIKKNSNIAACIDGDFPDSRTLVVYGKAELIEVETPESEKIQWELIVKYHETEQQARDYQNVILTDLDLVLIKLEPTKIIAMDFNKNNLE